MGYPKRRDEFDQPAEGAGARPSGPVLVEADVRPATATAPALTPPPRIPPGIAATGFGPAPDPRRRLEPIPVDANAGWRSGPAFIAFLAGQTVSIIAILLVILLAGVLASLAQAG